MRRRSDPERGRKSAPSEEAPPKPSKAPYLLDSAPTDVQAAHCEELSASLHTEDCSSYLESYEDCGLRRPELITAVGDCGLYRPTMLHQSVIPMACSGHDWFVESPDGENRIVAYVLPCLDRLSTASRDVQVLIVAHEKKRAFEIHNIAGKIANCMQGTFVEVVYGGRPIKKDKEMLTTVLPQILIATPGRLLSLLRDEATVLGEAMLLDKCHTVIIDDATNLLDKLDMRRDVQKLLSGIAGREQIMVFGSRISDDLWKSSAFAGILKSSPSKFSFSDYEDCTLVTG